MFYFFPRTLLFWFSCLVAALVINYLKTGKFKERFKFSARNYYLLVLPLLFSPLYLSYKEHSWFPIILFFVFAIVGVLGETLFSLWWHVFFEKRFYVYRVETLVHQYTSLLNFIPWGAGGMLYLNIVSYVSMRLAPTAYMAGSAKTEVPFWIIFLLGNFIGIGIQLLIWQTFFVNRNQSFKFKNVTAKNYLFFCLPFLLSLFFCVYLYGSIFIFLAVFFGVFATLAEYLFGKAVELLISKKLWIYQYAALDNGHFTPLIIIPFAVVGFYFWAAALIVSYFIR